MLHSWLFGFLGLNVAWGIANLILASELAENRVDDISADGGMGQDWDSLRRRYRASSYGPSGRRLLRWYVASSVAQMIAFLAWVFFLAPV